MNITVYTIGYNEEFLIPHFLNHYSYANQIIYYDNQSTDNSRELLSKDSRVKIIEWDTNNEQDNNKLRDLKNNCWKGDTSDWVIVCDIDEFLIGMPPEKIEPVIYQSEGWQVVGMDGQNLSDMNLFYRDYNFDKCILFSPKIKEIGYGHGAHMCFPSHPVIKGKYKLFHYSFLGEEYIINRWKKWANRACENDKKKGYGHQYFEDAIEHYKDARRKCKKIDFSESILI